MPFLLLYLFVDWNRRGRCFFSSRIAGALSIDLSWSIDEKEKPLSHVGFYDSNKFPARRAQLDQNWANAKTSNQLTLLIIPTFMTGVIDVINQSHSVHVKRKVQAFLKPTPDLSPFPPIPQSYPSLASLVTFLCAVSSSRSPLWGRPPTTTSSPWQLPTFSSCFWVRVSTLFKYVIHGYFVVLGNLQKGIFKARTKKVFWPC